jgi:hypothetical protein
VRANIQLSGLTTKKPDNNRFDTVLKPDNNRFPTVSGFPLGNVTTHSAEPVNKAFQHTEKSLQKLKYDYKRQNIERKKKIGRIVKRVSYCGTRSINKSARFINAVQGEKGGVYYNGMMRCGCIWLCPDCMYKLMKGRADELYNQLQAYKEKKKTILFVTFTLQHRQGDKLQDLHNKLLYAFNFANTSRKWTEAKKDAPVEYLRTLEVLLGSQGWHPHLHTVFVGDEKLIKIIDIFRDLYKQKLSSYGLIVNSHTVVIDKWNGKMDDMTDYMFKGMLEQELTGGGLKKSGSGKTFFELIDSGNDRAAREYIEAIKGKRQYHHSKEFFSDVRTKTEAEHLRDDKTEKVLFSIPVSVYADINKKGIAIHLLNEFNYGGRERAEKLLDLYDCDSRFLDGIVIENGENPV